MTFLDILKRELLGLSVVLMVAWIRQTAKKGRN